MQNASLSKFIEYYIDKIIKKEYDKSKLIPIDTEILHKISR